MRMMINGDFEIIKINRQYTVKNWKLNTTIQTFTKYIDAYKCLTNLLYTDLNK